MRNEYKVTLTGSAGVKHVGFFVAATAEQAIERARFYFFAAQSTGIAERVYSYLTTAVEGA